MQGSCPAAPRAEMVEMVEVDRGHGQAAGGRGRAARRRISSSAGPDSIRSTGVPPRITLLLAGFSMTSPSVRLHGR